MINEEFGIEGVQLDDLDRAYTHMIANGDAVIQQSKKYYVCYLGRKGYKYLNDHANILEKYGHRLVDYAANPPLYRDAMGRYRYIFRAKNESEIADIATYVLDKPPEAFEEA